MLCHHDHNEAGLAEVRATIGKGGVLIGMWGFAGLPNWNRRFLASVSGNDGLRDGLGVCGVACTTGSPKSFKKDAWWKREGRCCKLLCMKGPLKPSGSVAVCMAAGATTLATEGHSGSTAAI